MGATPAFVGVCSSVDIATNLKKLLLMFDKLAVVDLEALKSGVSLMPQKLSVADMEALRKGVNPFKSHRCPKLKRNRALVANLEWLEKENIVFEAAVDLESVSWWPGEPKTNASQIPPPFDDFVPNPAIPNELLPTVFQLCEAAHKDWYQTRRLSRALPHFMVASSTDSLDLGILTTMRIYSHALKQTDGYDAVPVYFGRSQPGQELPSGKESVLRIVMPLVPEPDDTTSLENILDFRSDEEAKSAFRKMRRWMSNLSKGSFEVIEVQTEIADLLAEYQRYMSIHHIDTRSGLLESIVVTSAEIAERIVKLEWSTLAKGLFRIHSDKIALMRAEMEAPGREVAYLSMMKRRFLKRQSRAQIPRQGKHRRS